MDIVFVSKSFIKKSKLIFTYKLVVGFSVRYMVILTIILLYIHIFISTAHTPHLIALTVKVMAARGAVLLLTWVCTLTSFFVLFIAFGRHYAITMIFKIY